MACLLKLLMKVSVITLLVPNILFGNTHNSYTVGVYENPPLVFTQDGVAKGFLIDLISYVAKKENLELNFIPCEWTQCLEQLKNGSIDLLLPVAFSQERIERFNFNQVTVFTSWGELYCNVDFKLQTLEGLQNKVIALVQRDIYTEAFQRIVSSFNIKGISYETAKDYEDVFRIVHNGEVDCGVASRLSGFVFLERYRNVHRTPVSFQPTDLRIAANKGMHSELLQRIDTYIRVLKDDPNSPYYEFLNKWIFQVPETRGWFKWILLGFVCSLAILLGIVVILRYLVVEKTKDLKRFVEMLKVELQYKEELRETLEAEKQLRQLLIDNLQAGVIVADTEGRILIWNIEALRWFKNIGEMVSKDIPLWKIFPGLESQMERSFNSTLEGFEHQLEWECREGRSLPRVAKIYLRRVKAHNTYILTLIQDITELKEIARFYENRWSFFQQIVDKMPLPLFIINTEGNVIVWNEACEKITGLYKEDVLQKPLDLSPLFFGGKKILIPAILLMNHEPEEIERITNGRIRVSSDFPQTVEATGWIWSREQKRYVKILASRLTDQDGNVVGYLQCARDITEEINLQKTLAEAQKAESIARLTSAFTHELNNLLTIILGVCDMLSFEFAKSPQIQPYLGMIRDTVHKGSTLSGYFQKMGRSDESSVEKKPFNDTIQEVLDPLMPLLRDILNLQCKFESNIGKVNIRRSEFETAIFSLLVTNREDLSLSKNVVLETRVEKQQVALITPDIRIPPGTYAVLSITYLEDGKSDKKQPPFGRLSFINRIVEQAGGYMTIGDLENHTKVEIKFPLEANYDVDDGESGVEILKGKTVFIVEDDSSLMNVLRSSLRLYGVNVIEAFSLEEAWSKWWDYINSIDFAILDVNLQAGTSIELSELMRDSRPSIPIIFISGYDKPKLSTRLDHEGTAFIKKPFELTKLIHLAVNLLSRTGNK
ncbi:MAG: transporter substrate-binding domain-containing protein [Syntrophobacterales bacterium]|nr:transporter substrate-binding domain-containing protein [Syntrophobacterales bacterium]